MGKIVCVEFHTKYLTHALEDVHFLHSENLRAFRYKKTRSVLFHCGPDNRLSVQIKQLWKKWQIDRYFTVNG